MSLKEFAALLALLLGAAPIASADTLQLKDRAALTGTLLAEKPDAVVLDIGYTVLVVPRHSIASITRNGSTPAPAAPAASFIPAPSNTVATVNVPPQLYYSTLLTSPT